MEHESINCRYHLPFHRGWGGFAEELFYHTSRYYFATEAFLRNIAAVKTFSMAGYKAEYLSSAQRELMAALLSHEPTRHPAAAVISIVSAVESGTPDVNQELADFYLGQQEKPQANQALTTHHYFQGNETIDAPPLDPFLNMAERLQLPVAVRGHHVEISLKMLAGHLDSANSTIRTNLQTAILQLHNGGYVLKNHPHLTHMEARTAADCGSD